MLISRSKAESLVSNTKVLSGSRSEMLFDDAWTDYIHCAFATREQYFSLGPSSFVAENRTIIEDARKDILKGRPSRVIVISSGAVAKTPLSKGIDKSYETYASMKSLELEILREAAHSIGANFLEGRLFSATGIHMKSPQLFAIGSFIRQALSNQKIVISSKNPTYRRYCDAVQFMKVLLTLNQGTEDVTIESGGIIVEIGDLATEVIRALDLNCEVQRSDFQGGPIDDYFSRSWRFEEELYSLGEKPLDLRQQIANVRERLEYLEKPSSH